jgi:TolA-binding protein
MNRPIPFSTTLIALAIASPPLLAADNTQLQQLQQEIAAMRKDYEKQLNALEARLKQAEARLASQAAPAGQLPAAQAVPSSAPTVAVDSSPPSAGAPAAARATSKVSTRTSPWYWPAATPAFPRTRRSTAFPAS